MKHAWLYSDLRKNICQLWVQSSTVPLYGRGRETETETQRERDRDRDTEGQTDRQRQIQPDRDKGTEGQRDRDKECVYKLLLLFTILSVTAA